jgi:hypothetical protein
MPSLIEWSLPQQQGTVGCGCGCGGAGTGCSCGCSACETLTTFERPRFFSGQLLTESELNGEQRYVVDKNRLHNRLLHGYGAVCGLRVSCCDATHVTVEAGYAIDPCGNDIVLAESTTVDFVSLVRDCRNRTQSAADCNPFLATNLTGCEGADQTWCLTIAYAERDARPVASLRSSAGTHGSAATTAGCGCGCNGNGNGKASSTAVDSVGRTATACEPTRVVETSTFDVACMPARTTLTREPNELDRAHATLAERAPAGTLIGDLLRCQADFVVAIDAKPDLANLQPQEAYTVVCRWLRQVRATLAAHPTTHCGIANSLAQIIVPAPPQAQPQPPPNVDVVENVAVAAPPAEASVSPADYGAKLADIESEVEQLLAAAARECLCWNLIPACPPAPTDNCVVLACVTLRNDVIVDICMGWPRRQVITFPDLEYWLTGLAATRAPWATQLPTLLSPQLFGRTLSLLCCREDAQEVPRTPEASRFYAVADITQTTAPRESVSGISPTEFHRLRSNVAAIRETAVNIFRRGQ